MSETQVTTEAQIEVIDDLDAFSNDFFGQESDTVEEKTPTTTEPAEQDEVTKPVSEDTEAQTDDEQDEAELQEEISEKPKRQTVQDRINELVRQREEQKRESEAQLAALRQEIEDFKKGAAPAQAAPEKAEPTPDDVDADGEALYPLGEFDPLYIRDLTRFTLNQERERVQMEEIQAKAQAEVRAAEQALQTQWNEKLTNATQEYPDLMEKGRDLLNGFNDLDPNYAGYLSAVIMSMDKGPDVLYYLSNHPEEANEIVNSGAQRATLALGRIEARFLKDEEAAPKKKFTKAPTPPQERTRGTNGAFISVAPDTDDLDAFAAEFFKKK